MTAIQVIEGQSMQESEKAHEVPTLPTVIVDAEASEQLMNALRHFHLGEPGAREKIEEVGSDTLPVLLNNFRDVSKIRYDYPLFLFPAEAADDSPLARPLSRFLVDTVEGFAPGAESARILKDNLSWLERELCRRLQGQEVPTDAAPLVAESATALQEHLDLGDEHRERLQADLDNLTGAIEAGSQFLGYGRYAAIHLLIRVLRRKVTPRRAAFRKEVKELIVGLKALLAVEAAKSEAARKPESLRAGIGIAGTFFDTDALSSVAKHSQGSVTMDPARQQRIEAALKALQGYEDDPVLVRFVHIGKLADSWLDETADFEAVSDNDPCAVAQQTFDREAEKMAKVFAAARIARLEIAGKYDAAIHDPWFNTFNWEGFSREELLLVPTVVALDSAVRVAGEGMPSFSRLLSSGRPVQILIRVQAHNNPAAGPGEDPFQSYRVELGYVGMAYRQAYVSQSTPARYEHLLKRYREALDTTRTGLHLISTGVQVAGDEAEPLDPWFVASAALESRSHPFFRVDPAAGDDAAARVDFSANPQAELDWPVHDFCFQNDNGEKVEQELPFTYADYAMLIPRLRGHFGLISPACQSPDLVPVKEWVVLPEEEAARSVPFIWGVDSLNALHRVVITRALALACKDRLSYWRSLQELAGVRSRYIDLATQKAAEEAQNVAATELQLIRDQFEAELERVRTETAGEALGRLAEALVGMDLSAVKARGPATASAMPAAAPEAEAAPAAAEEAAPEPAPEPEPEEEEVSFSDPWIETILCTSCNDCINLNPQLFVYNDDKQALIGDPKAGTYAQLVESAEFCPANCIHPGKPLNPDEPGLEELIQRAEPYN